MTERPKQVLIERADPTTLLGVVIDSVEEYAILMLDPAGRVATWNAGAARIKGYTTAEALGQHFEIFYPEPDRRAGKPGKALASALENGVYKEQGWRLRRDGSAFMADVVITPVRDADGDLLGYVKVTRDVTESLRIATEGVALEALARRDRVSTEFADTVVRSIFSVGLQLQSIMSQVPGALRPRLDAAVDELDRTLKQVRAIILDL